MSRSTTGDQQEVLKELLAIAMSAQEGCQCCCVPDLLSEGAHNTEKGEYHMRSSQPLGVLEGFDVPVKWSSAPLHPRWKKILSFIQVTRKTTSAMLWAAVCHHSASVPKGEATGEPYKTTSYQVYKHNSVIACSHGNSSLLPERLWILIYLIFPTI